MSLPKYIGLFTVFFTFARLSANAEDLLAGDNATNLPPSLQASVKTGEIIGDRPIEHAYVTFGTNQFSFILPEGFRIDCSNPDKLVIVNKDYDCFVNFRVVEPMPSETRELNPAIYRDLLLTRYPGARITDEYFRSVANRSGPAFDLQWQNSGANTQSARVIFVPMAAGVLEFSLVTDKNNFFTAEHFFHFILLTFRSNESGKLEVAHLSDKA